MNVSYEFVKNEPKYLSICWSSFKNNIFCPLDHCYCYKLLLFGEIENLNLFNFRNGRGHEECCLPRRGADS